jgi:hypothetical protein
MKESFSNENSFKSQERKLWGDDWKSVRTYTDVASFYQDASKVIDGNPPPGLRATFDGDYSRKKLKDNLEDVLDAYRGKAEKERKSTTIEVAYTKYRPYVILRTTPDHEVIVWSWWQNPQKRLAGDIAGTFSD